MKRALTPEEWESAGEPRVERDGIWMYAPHKADLVVVGFPGESGIGIGGDDLHPLAALSLHDQPFGFTHADVDLLRRATVIFRVGDMETMQDERDTARLRELADRIAALLPPHEP